MNLDRLYEILHETTVQLRKGAEVEERTVGNVQVTEVYAIPHESAAKTGIEKVDCHFIVVGVDRVKAQQYKDELMGILKTYPNQERLSSGGSSYIEVGAEIGDQGAAFQLFALGQVLGFWEVETPEKAGITGDQARQMAGMGFVTITGFKAS